jgi:hypothetical protein
LDHRDHRGNTEFTETSVDGLIVEGVEGFIREEDPSLAQCFALNERWVFLPDESLAGKAIDGDVPVNPVFPL